MHAFLSLPAPVLPNAFLYEVIFASILGVVLALVAMFPLLRRRQFAAILILIGISEFFIFAYYGYYTIPVEVFIISFVTIISGIIIPIFYVTRKLLSKKGVRLLLIFSGCVEFALGAISLLYARWGIYNEYVLSIFRENGELLFLGSMLATIGAYSFAVGASAFATKPKNMATKCPLTQGDR